MEVDKGKRKEKDVLVEREKTYAEFGGERERLATNSSQKSFSPRIRIKTIGAINKNKDHHY